MPTPRKYATNAARQAAYRARLTARPTVPITAPPIIPGTRRWAVMLRQACDLLSDIAGEMATYRDARSEAWQDSERGEALTERIETVEAILDLLGDLTPTVRRR